jgi:hypothetical protein
MSTEISPCPTCTIRGNTAKEGVIRRSVARRRPGINQGRATLEGTGRPPQNRLLQARPLREPEADRASVLRSGNHHTPGHPGAIATHRDPAIPPRSTFAPGDAESAAHGNTAHPSSSPCEAQPATSWIRAGVGVRLPLGSRVRGGLIGATVVLGERDKAQSLYQLPDAERSNGAGKESADKTGVGEGIAALNGNSRDNGKDRGALRRQVRAFRASPSARDAPFVAEAVAPEWLV